MNVQQFQYILALAENRHFETAAEKCCITQSTLSTMISKFEDEIGIIIFDRRKKPVGITKEGELILKQLRIITDEILHLNEIVNEIRGEIKGTIKISCISTVAPFLFPLFLQDFSGKNMQLHITIKESTTDEIVRQLKSREIDIGILSTPIEDHELKEYALYTEPFVLYDASNSIPQKYTVEELDLSNFWLLEEGHCMRTQVLEICEFSKKEINPSINVNFKAGSVDSLIRFAKANKGKTLLPLLALLNSDEKAHSGFFKEPAPYRNIGLVTHRHFAKKKILNLLQNEIKEKVTPIIEQLNGSKEI